MGVGKSKVSDARTVLKDKEAKKKVATGKKSLHAAAKEVRAKKSEGKEKPAVQAITVVESIMQSLEKHKGGKDIFIGGLEVEAMELFETSGKRPKVNEFKKTMEIIIQALIYVGVVEKSNDTITNIEF